MSVLTLTAVLDLPLAVAACVAAIAYVLGFDNGYLRARRELGKKVRRRRRGGA